MIDKIEIVVNMLSDMDWSWWPLLSWRPAKNENIGNVLLMKISTVFGSAVGLIFLLYFHNKMAMTFGNIALIFIFGWVFFFVAYKFLFAYFWNRRATRLRSDPHSYIQEFREKEPKANLTLLLFGGVLILISLAVQLSSSNMSGFSLLDIYSLGWLNIIAGVAGLVGAGVIFFSMFTAVRPKDENKEVCPACGANISEDSDRFCRKCGVEL